MNCEKCLHRDACLHLIDETVEELVPCVHFAEKTKYISLPQDIGKEVWILGQPCGGCPNYNEPMSEKFIEECRNCKKWEIGKCSFDYDLIPEFGKLVFLTKEEAEERLKELLENET